MSIEHKLREWEAIKQKLNHYHRQEALIKDEIHAMMNDMDSNIIEGDTLMCHRSIVNTRRISSNDVPPDIWERYAVMKRYPRLTLRRI